MKHTLVCNYNGVSTYINLRILNTSMTCKTSERIRKRCGGHNKKSLKRWFFECLFNIKISKYIYGIYYGISKFLLWY